MKITYLNKYHYFNASIMPVNPTMVHVGVWGEDSFVEFRRLYPASRMMAYEADPDNFAAMDDRMNTRGVEFYNTALSGETGPVILNKYGSKVSHSLFPRHQLGTQKMELKGTVEVQGNSLRDLMDNDVMERINLLILNCEGAEVFALDALLEDESLRNLVDQICVSFHAPRIYPMGRKNKLLERLKKCYHVVVEKHEVGIPDVLLVRKR